jgi:hypothetical protein
VSGVWIPGKRRLMARTTLLLALLPRALLVTEAPMLLPVWYCLICGIQFPDREWIGKHVKATHHGVGCKQAVRAFPSRQALERYRARILSRESPTHAAAR